MFDSKVSFTLAENRIGEMGPAFPCAIWYS